MQTPQSIKHTTQGLSTQSQPRSAQRSLVKVESGINGLLPTSWAPPIYSVSLLTKLRCALTGHCFLPLAAVRSFLARICQTQKTNQEVRKNHRGLDNVGFIGASPLCFFPRVQSEDASPTSHGRRPIFIATLRAGASWLFFCVALSTRIIKIWVFVRALNKQPTDFLQSSCYFGDRTLARIANLS